MITINKERFLSDFHSQGRIGWIEGKGLFRNAYSESYFSALDFIRRKMEEAGFLTFVDSVGNLIGRLESREKNAKTILVGSHLDSVSGGGYYDGALGIIAGLEAIRAIKESGASTKHHLEVVAFVAEEGGPLGGTFGSRSFTGRFDSYPEAALLKEYDLDLEKVKKAKRNIDDYAAFLELHVEQGPFLWKKNTLIGIPTHIVGITRYLVTITGEANHAGTTPMMDRKDALYEGSRLVREWLDFMRKQEDIVGNVGIFRLYPGEIGVVPAKLEIGFEIRSGNRGKVDLSGRKIIDLSNQVDACKAEVRLWTHKEAVPMDESLVQAIEKTCRNLDFACTRMPSWASHDANPLARVMPAGMIFVPSVNGKSHSKDEFTEDGHLVQGVEVLAETLFTLDRDLE